MSNKLYSCKEAAAHLGYRNDSSIRRAIYAKKLHARKIGNSYVISHRDLMEWQVIHPHYNIGGSKTDG